MYLGPDMKLLSGTHSFYLHNPQQKKTNYKWHYSSWQNACKINKSRIADELDHSLTDDIKSLNKCQNFIY